jgi:peptidyl-Lys metalloendopeptidase
MEAKKQNLWAWKTLFGVVILIALFAILSHKNLRFANSQGVSAKTPMSAVVGLSVDRGSFDESDDVIVHVTITNPNSSSIRILKWFTPLGGVERSLFTVSRNGEPVPYAGRMVKRAAPKEKDYIALMAGECMTSDVQLSDYYAFSVSDNYKVMYDVTSLQLYMEDEIGQLNDGRLASNTLSLFIKGRASPVHQDTQIAPSPKHDLPKGPKLK